MIELDENNSLIYFTCKLAIKGMVAISFTILGAQKGLNWSKLTKNPNLRKRFGRGKVGEGAGVSKFL